MKFARLNFFVPVPQVRDFDELNSYLLQRCREDLGRRLRGQTGTKTELLARTKRPSCRCQRCRLSPVGTRAPRPVRCR